MLEQTLAARAGLRRAGLCLKDFSTQVERIVHGRTFVGWGNVQVRVKNHTKAFVRTAQIRAEGFSVTHYSLSEGSPLVFISDDGKGQLHVMKYEQKEDGVV